MRPEARVSFRTWVHSCEILRDGMCPVAPSCRPSADVMGVSCATLRRLFSVTLKKLELLIEKKNI